MCLVLYNISCWPRLRDDTHTPTSRDKSAVCLLRAGHWSSAAILNGMENGQGGGGLLLWKLLLHAHYTKVSVRIKYRKVLFFFAYKHDSQLRCGEVNAVQQCRKKDLSIIPSIIHDLACVFINWQGCCLPTFTMFKSDGNKNKIKVNTNTCLPHPPSWSFSTSNPYHWGPQTLTCQE